MLVRLKKTLPASTIDSILLVCKGLGSSCGFPDGARNSLECVGEVCDMFQIGTRNMTNAPLLREVGKMRKPILLRRGFAATVCAFLLAAEFILPEAPPAAFPVETFS